MRFAWDCVLIGIVVFTIACLLGDITFSQPTIYCIKAPCPQPLFVMNSFGTQFGPATSIKLFAQYVFGLFVTGWGLSALYYTLKNARKFNA